MSTQHHYTGKLPTVKKHNCTSTSLIERERESAVTDCFYVSFQLFTAVIDKLLIFYQVSATCSSWMFRSFGGNYSLYLQGDSLVHMDAEIQKMQPLHGAETQKKTSICICDFKLCTISSWWKYHTYHIYIMNSNEPTCQP